MRQPESLTPLVDRGIIQEVVRPLMSGKEAQIFLVVSGGELRVAKVYKEAHNRTFRQRAEYTEGRGGRNTRTQRAKGRRSRFGRAEDEASWRSAEVDIIYRLRAAGVRVPEPHVFLDGVLVMELITDASGDPAPRLTDVVLGRQEAGDMFAALLSSVVKMLHAGVVHGDLSEFNVLVGHDGPVIIDFPQSVDPAYNRNARKLLVRDIDNLSQFLLHDHSRRRRGPQPYGQELWALYERSELTPDTQLTGRYSPPRIEVNDSELLYEIEVAEREARKARDAKDARKRRGGQGPRTREAARQRRRSANTASPAAATATTTSAPKPASAPQPVRGKAQPARGKAQPVRGKAQPVRRPARGKAKPATKPATQPATTRTKPVSKPGGSQGNRPASQTMPALPGARRRRRRRRRRRGSSTTTKTD